MKLKSIYLTMLSVTFLLLLSFHDSSAPEPYSFPKNNLFPPVQQPADNPATVEGVALGAKLFFEKALSRDSSISCGSCHKPEFAFSSGPVRFSSGIDGELMSRNTPGLFNLAWSTSFFWDGRAKTLEEQAYHPVRNRAEMDLSWSEAVRRLNGNAEYQKMFSQAFQIGTIDSTHVVKALAQYLRTLISANSKFDSVIVGLAHFSKEEYRGFVVANDQSMGECLHCHHTDGQMLGTDFRLSNNGLDAAIYYKDFKDPGAGLHSKNDSSLFGKFKTPSLRNLKFTAPYMHDGRFRTLEEVVDFYCDSIHLSPGIDPRMTSAARGGVSLTQEDRKALVAFLKTM